MNPGATSRTWWQPPVNASSGSERRQLPASVALAGVRASTTAPELPMNHVHSKTQACVWSPPPGRSSGT